MQVHGQLKAALVWKAKNRPVINSLNVEENDPFYPNSMMALLPEINTHHHK